MSRAPFPINPELTAVTLAYRNRRYIADQVLPRVPVNKQEFGILKDAAEESFTIPNTRVGRKSKTNRVEFHQTKSTDSTEPGALEEAIPQLDIDNAMPNQNPLSRATERVTDLVALDREKRTADKVFNAGAFVSGLKDTLTSGDQWSAPGTSTPVADIIAASRAMMQPPTLMVVGPAVFDALRVHPQVLKAVYGPAASDGLATAEQIAKIFNLDAVLVGEARYNSAKKGQNAAYADVWGKFCALLSINRLADNFGGATFGFTAEMGQRSARSFFDKDIGPEGGQIVRVAENVKEVITEPLLGFLFSTAVA